MHTPEGRRLFAEYRAAPEGPRKQRLLNLLIINNEPLAKLIIGQLCGFAESTKRRGFRAMGGCQGFHRLGATLEGQEQAIQQGRIALGRALAKFDPSRGCAFSYVVKLWCRDQLQQFVRHGQDLVRVPHDAAEEGVGVTLLGEERDLDVRAGGGEDADLLRVSGGGDDFEDARQRLTDEDIERWQESGELPEWAAAMREQAAPIEPSPKVVIDSSDPNGLDEFLRHHLVFHTKASALRSAIWGRYESLTWGEPAASPRTLYRALRERGARPTTMRTYGPHPEPAFRGVALRQVSTISRPVTDGLKCAS